MFTRTCNAMAFGEWVVAGAYFDSTRRGYPAAARYLFTLGTMSQNVITAMTVFLKLYMTMDKFTTERIVAEIFPATVTIQWL